LILEVQDLKKKNRFLSETSSHLKAENHRLEIEAMKQQKRIEQLMNLSEGAKNFGLSAEIKKEIEKSILVRQLKNQINILKSDIAGKEADLERLQKTIKATHVTEVECEKEEYMMEVERLKCIVLGLKDELLREKRRREWNLRLASGDNGDDIRKEIARLSTGYQHILSNISTKSTASSQRPMSASSSVTNGGSTVTSSGQPSKLVRPLSADGTRLKQREAAIASADMNGQQQKPLLFYYHSGPTANINAETPATDAEVVFDPLDNFGLQQYADTKNPLPVSVPLITPDPTEGVTMKPVESFESFEGSLSQVQTATTNNDINSLVSTALNGSFDKKKPQTAVNTKYKVGQQIEALYYRGTSWYKGSIRATHSIAPGEVVYDITYDDGDRELKVIESNIRPKTSTVEGSTTDRPVMLLEQPAVKVDTASAVVSKAVAAIDSKEETGAYRVGDKVEARYGGGSKWYGAIVTASSKNKPDSNEFVYNLRYDDGDNENRVSEEFIRNVPTSTVTASSSQQTTNNSNASFDPVAMTSPRDTKAQEIVASKNPISSLSVNPSKVSPSVFSKGDRVQGYFEALNEWFNGSIKEVRSDGTYHVLFDDGDEETDIPIRRLRPLISNSTETVADTPLIRSDIQQVKDVYTAGDHVEALFDNGDAWYGATIKSINKSASSDFTYSLRYDDGDEESNVPAKNIRRSLHRAVSSDSIYTEPNNHETPPQPSQYSTGDHVEALFDNGDAWYGATIKSINKSASSDYTYSLRYDDGDEESNVSAKNIRHVVDQTPSSSSSDHISSTHEVTKLEKKRLPIVATTLESYLGDISDDDDDDLGNIGGLDAGPALTLNYNANGSARVKVDSDEYDEDFDP
jgi:hypothetical protein